jgi:hypothetical protein
MQKNILISTMVLFMVPSISLFALGEEYRQWISIKDEMEGSVKRIYHAVIDSTTIGEIKSNDGLIIGKYDKEKDYGYIFYSCDYISSVNIGFCEEMRLLYKSPSSSFENDVYLMVWNYLGQFEFFESASFIHDIKNNLSGILLHFNKRYLGF